MALPLPPTSAAGPAPDSAREALSKFIGTTYTTSELRFYINGRKVILSNPDPHWTLLDYIRAQSSLKGTKLGCGEGGCGACTVVLQVKDSSYNASTNKRRTVCKAVNACLYPLVGVDGKQVITIEGIGNIDRPHPLQERIAKLHGSQCGFCTPGIVMSLYALVRNCYDPETCELRINEHEIEKEGHLDGNLCRCTGYKPILQAAKTFITEDLKGEFIPTPADLQNDDDEEEEEALRRIAPKKGCGRPGGCCQDERASAPAQARPPSCGREGGCCRDTSPASATSAAASSSDNGSDSEATAASSEVEFEITSSPKKDSALSGASYAMPIKSHEKKPEAGSDVVGEKTTSLLDSAPQSSTKLQFAPYSAMSELIFPPALWSYEAEALCYGNEKKVWFRPTSLQQLLELKNSYPSAKLVGGASEVQVEVRFKNSDFAVSVYVSDIPELNKTEVPSSDEEVQKMTELLIGGNTPLTEVEALCGVLYQKLGQRAAPLEALRKQLRYFAGRQIRNAASLAGNVATASPISDACPVLLACGASVIARSWSKGEVEIPLSEFFIAYRTTALPPDAVITHIKMPLSTPGVREITKAYKQAKRKDDDIAIVTASFQVRLDENGIVQTARLAYGGMAPMPVLAKSAAASLIGKTWFDSRTLDDAMDALMDDFDLSYSVPGGMASYRRCLTLSLFFRFWNTVVKELELGEVPSELVEEIHREISDGSRDNYNALEQRVVGKQVPHLSALKQCTGEAEYLDDIPVQHRELFGGLVLSSKAHAKLVSVDWAPALDLPGVVGYIDRYSIPKELNIWGSVKKDEPFFAEDEVYSHGQVIGMLYAETALQAYTAARAVNVVYEDLPVILTIDDAIEQKSLFKHGKELRKGAALEGKMDEVFARAERTFEGITKMGGQEHFYLETQASLVIPSIEDGQMTVWSSTQNTMETQEFVSQVTGVPSNRINAKVKRMGGAFGGKESRSVPVACMLAIAAKKERRPMRLMLSREEDMKMTGQRHPFQARWKVAASNDGKLIALDVDIYNNAGWSQDMSGAVMDRCCTHIDNCYEWPNAWIRGHCCKTNTHSNTAYRGFGGPQAMYIAESIINAVAEGLNIDIDVFRRKNLYTRGDRTPFFQQIDEDWHIPTLLNQLSEKCEYEKRKASVTAFNDRSKWRKRGISLVPCKFGISFATALHLNQAVAYVKIFADGSILLHHGGTEMGQGLYTKMCQVCAQELNVPLDAVYTDDSSSYQTANASPTAASAGSDLNGMAVKHACDQLNERLEPYREKYGRDAPMKELAHAAYLDRVNLAANGFWKMPKIGFEWGNFDMATNKPMYYYWTQGVACSEVELDLLTGDHTVLCSDIMMDIGRSINPALDYGQIEGAFTQGLGLFTMEESLWSSRTGALATTGPGTYKIPGFSDIPQVFNVSMLRHDENGKMLDWKHLKTIQSSKGVGEPPLFLGSTVFFALRGAVKAARKMHGVVEGKQGFVLDSPATAEKLRMSVGDRLAEKAKVIKKDGEVPFFVTVA